MKRIGIRSAFIALLIVACCVAPGLDEVVSPGSDFYFLDNANVLSEALEGEIYFSNKLLCEDCGAQIVVVTVDTTGSEGIDDYAYDLFNQWGIGDASKNNGFLLLLAIDDDNYYVLPGSGLESSMRTDTLITYMDTYLEPDFAAGDYEAGVQKFFEVMFAYIADLYNAEATTAQGIADYNAYVTENDSVEGLEGYNGSWQSGEQQIYEAPKYEHVGLGAVVFIALVVLVTGQLQSTLY